jgi:hypothetical protein
MNVSLPVFESVSVSWSAWRRLVVAGAWVVMMCGGGSGAMAQDRIQERVLDDFDDASAWSVVATDDVKASLRGVPGAGGNAGDRALCLDFDFGRVTGYVALRRRLPIAFPARFDIGFDVRGTMPQNALQLKFSDASGDNVWWAQRRDYQPPQQWQRLRVRQRQVEFAWGPATDKVLRRTEWVEFVIATGGGPAEGAGDPGANKGSLCVDRLSLRELPAPPQVAPTPVARASSSLPGHAPFGGLVASYDSEVKAGAPGAAVADWEPERRDAEPTLTVDYGTLHEFSALLLHWRPGAAAARYTIEASDDGVAWRPVQRVERARGELQAHWLGESEARYLRLRFERGAAAAYAAPIALRGIELRNALSPNAFFTLLAARAPRGAYPRAYGGEQSYWTVLGVEGARIASLLSEDGVLEPVPGVGALEPLLITHERDDKAGKVLGWHDAQIEHTLVDGVLPMPRVHWRAGDFALAVEAFGDGTPDAAQALASYRVRNVGTRTRSVTLALAWRPFQANPPTQFLAHPGGASAVRELDWDGQALRVNGLPRVRPLTRPDAVRLEPLAAGQLTAWAGERGGLDAAARPQRIADPAGYASAALSYRLTLKPGEERVIGVALPVRGSPVAPSAAAFAQHEARVAQAWRQRLGGVTLTGGAEVQEVARTLRTALGHILVNRSGPALQPGARAYARSWIRDGAMTSSALLRLGRDDVARDFLRWYAPFQFANGKVPCCATVRGADPVPENDSHGELAYAAADLWRYTHDAALARAMWPHVRAAIDYMEQLRQSQRNDANRGAEHAGYFGMMPPSISHEGYSDKAAYSYWDDHWAWIGYRSAVELAQGLGLNDEAARIAAQRDEFRHDLLASIAATAQRYKLDVLAGAADRGDFDPTSSTIALSPGGLLGTLPDALVRNTFERYWREFEQRRADDAAGVRHGDGAYTPYEWRVVGSLVRLGQRERALDALRYFYRDRRPAGWRQWAEVVLRNAREPRFLGDMPHGWVASDHIRSVLDLFAYEHEGERSLVLAAGVPMAWLRDGEGVAIAGLRTPYGMVSWRARGFDTSARTAEVGSARTAEVGSARTGEVGSARTGEVGSARTGEVGSTRTGGRVEFEVSGLREMPPGGLWLRGPWPANARVAIDGVAVPGAADAIRLPATTARVRVEWTGP